MEDSFATVLGTPAFDGVYEAKWNTLSKLTSPGLKKVALHTWLILVAYIIFLLGSVIPAAFSLL